MIFGILDMLSDRRRVDKAYEMLNLVEEKMRNGGHSLDLAMIDGVESEEIVPPHVAITYLLIGFDPNKHPETGETMPVFEGSIDLAVRSSQFISLAESRSRIRNRQFDFLEQDMNLVDGYGCESVQDLLIEGNVSLRRSVRNLYNKSRKDLANTIATIATPLRFLGFQDKQRYVCQIKTAVQRDSPDIYGLAESVKLLTKSLPLNPHQNI